ncbi:MAG: LuxR family transcriptional regulator [Anaerolineaceae bacterium]|nr:LuxR family transcriptional regulator [Anaerolineaceae bacterium]
MIARHCSLKTSFGTSFLVTCVSVNYTFCMSTTILATKLYKLMLRPGSVLRPRLIERLNAGLSGKLTLMSAPAGFGKTTLVSEWISNSDHASACLTLDENDSDPFRFLTYLIAALETIAPKMGAGIRHKMGSPQPPPIDSVLTPLLNAIASISDDFVLILDDYHLLDSTEIDSALSFLIDNQPPQMHLVIATREDPRLPLARLRAHGQLTEIRAADLRFTADEASEFLNSTMGLNLSSGDVAALERRTEGWIAGLQLAAISMQGQQDNRRFIESFSGNHHFVLDYLMEEVLNRQPSHIQNFLLKTSILERFCGPLCAAILRQDDEDALATIEHIRQANLFLIPLDNERRWYRYHYLFADLLRQRLLRDSTGHSTDDVNELHTQASIWYETYGLEIEAFQHAIAINDIERAKHLIESEGTPLYLRGIVKPIFHWLESLSHHILDTHPSLWVVYASTLMLTGQHTSVEQKLIEAENALQNTQLDDTTQDIVGRIASMRATLAVIQNDVEAMIFHSNDALERLHPENLPIRIASYWTRGYAYQLQGSYRMARNSYYDVLQLSESGENSFYVIAATISLGQLQELDNQLHQASESYQSAITLSGKPSHPIASQAFLGLAPINYQWNYLELAQDYGKKCHELLQQMDNTDTTASYKVFLGYLHLSRRDFTSASDTLDEAEAFVRQNNFMFRLSDIVEAQIRVLIYRDNLTTALQLAEGHNLSISQARIYLAQKNASRALQILDPFIQKAKEAGLQNELLKGLVLQAVVYSVLNQEDNALEVLDESLALATRGGVIRIFVDEGLPMAQLLQIAHSRGLRQDYVTQLISNFSMPNGEPSSASQIIKPASQWIDPLSQREIEVLQLIASGLTNQDIANRLYISLHTAKVHARNIFSKLAVKNRTQAVAKGAKLWAF